MNVAATITYRDIFGHDLDAESVRDDARALSINDCLQSLGKLSHLLAVGEASEANSLVLRGLRDPGAVMLTIGMLRVGRPLIFGKRLLAAARVAILESEERDPDGFNKQRDLHRFVRLLLGVADVYDGGDTPSDPSAQVEWLSSLLLKRVGLPQRSFYSAVVRSVRVFVDLPNRRPELLDAEAPSVAFEREVGLALERYLAICFAIVVRFSAWNKEPDAWLLDETYFRNSKIEPEEFALAARTFSATVAELRKAIKQDLKDRFDTIDDIYPFIKSPLIEIEKGVYLTVDVETLGDALLGDGLYWRMKYNPGASKSERDNLSSALGHLVEAHCYEVAEPCFSNDEAGLLFPEISYRKVVGGERRRLDSPDLAIFEEPAAAFVEIGIDRPNMLETIIRGDLTCFDRDVEESILHRADQLSWKIDDFLNGDLVYHGVTADAVKRIHPVICLIDGFPGGWPAL